MSTLERIAEEKIRRAMQEGQFDQLPGRGKPLKLDDAPFTPADQRLAQHVLKNQGFLPDWMEARREIEARRSELRRSFRQASLQAIHPAERENLRQSFTQAVSALNRQILGYNVRVPGRSFECPALDAELEMQAALEHTGDKE